MVSYIFGLKDKFLLLTLIYLSKKLPNKLIILSKVLFRACHKVTGFYMSYDIYFQLSLN